MAPARDLSVLLLALKEFPKFATAERPPPPRAAAPAFMAFVLTLPLAEFCRSTKQIERRSRGLWQPLHVSVLVRLTALLVAQSLAYGAYPLLGSVSSASPTACLSRGYGRAVGDAKIEPI